jgi:hypothetical protein
MNGSGRQWDGNVRGYLHALPEAVAPVALRARVLDASMRSRPGPPAVAARRSRIRRLPLALAAAAAVAAIALRVVLAPETDVPDSQAIMAAQAMEHRVLDRGIAGDPALRAGIAQIDRALGDAYRRHAGDEELDALWRARTRALDAMDKGLTTAPVVPARI